MLEAPPANASARLGRRYADHSPILVYCLTTLLGWLLLAFYLPPAILLELLRVVPRRIARLFGRRETP